MKLFVLTLAISPTAVATCLLALFQYHPLASNSLKALYSLTRLLSKYC